MLQSGDILGGMDSFNALVLGLLLALTPCSQAIENTFVSHGRAPDPTAKILSELREADRRRIPVETALKARSSYTLSNPIVVTVTVTNLFDPPLLLNGRMLVNHRRLPGEISFNIIDPDGKRCDFKRLVSPLEPKEDDFVLLARGMSIQRSIDLADFFDLHKKGIYKVQTVYRNDLDHVIGNAHSWMGIASSDVTEIELK